MEFFSFKFRLIIDNGTPQQPMNVRRGSLGNILEVNKNQLTNQEKDSDDGGFLNRNSSSKRNYGNHQGEPNGQQQHESNKGKQFDTGRKMENEGGKVFYCSFTRMVCGSIFSLGEKERASSNIDSGRGSAAYSSGRRPPLDDVTDTACASPRGYDDTNDQGIICYNYCMTKQYCICSSRHRQLFKLFHIIPSYFCVLIKSPELIYYQSKKSNLTFLREIND